MEDDALTRRVLACCYAVHRELGPGYPLSTYKQALAIELKRAILAFERDETIPVLYLGYEIDHLQVDFVIDKIIMEVRAKPSLDKEDTVQAFAALKASSLTRCLLVAFGGEELQFKRLNKGVRLTL